MAWTSPRTWNVGELVTKLIMDTHIRDNLNYLKEQLDTRLKAIGRQGGSATNWETQGTTDYVPAGPVKIQTGVSRIANVNTATGSNFWGSVTVTLPYAFSDRAMVICSALGAQLSILKVSGITTTNNQTIVLYALANAVAANVDICWMVIGE